MIKFCKKCYEENRTFSPSGYYAFLKEETRFCILKDCQGELIDIDFPAKDLADIMRISESKDFIDAMIDLRQKDIIEYELKISQFRAQIEQQKKVAQQQDNQPRCPHCKSTNIAKIGTGERIGSIAVMGIFSKKINKSFKCKSCGYTW